MAISYLYGLQRNKLVMGPNFNPKRDDKGLWTATAEFRCISDDYESAPIQARLAKGVSLGYISETGGVGTEWNFLCVDSHEAEKQPGGMTVVTVQLKGFTDNQWDFDNAKNKTYSRNGTLTEESILNHPKFKAEVTGDLVQAFRNVMNGTWSERFDSDASQIILVATGGGDAPLAYITDGPTIEWWNLIIRKKQETFLSPAMEWTESATGNLPLTSADMASFGYIDNPPGGPGTPGNRNWLFTGITEQIEKTGEGVNQYSKTWTLSSLDPWPTKIYEKP